MKIHRKVLLAVCAALLFPLATIAADAETQLVTATGYGMSVDEAKKAAVRAAVESVVGTIVDAETLVENDELVQDKILSYSAGMVEAVKIIGEPEKTSSGLVTVRAQVKVRKTELVERVKSTIKTSVKVNGESLYQQASFNLQTHNDAAAIIQSLFNPKRFLGLLKFEPDTDKGSPISLDAATGEVTVAVKGGVNMAASKQWTDEIIEKLGPMATNKTFITTSSREISDNDDSFWYGKAGSTWIFGEGQGLYILRNYRSLEVVGLKFDDGKQALLENRLGHYGHWRSNCVVSVSLLDKTGETIKSANFWFDDEYVLVYGPTVSGYSIFPACPLLTKPDYLGPFSRGEVSLGHVKPQDLRDVDSVSVEVVMKKGN